MSLFAESSLEDLYQSAVEAFPHTTMRQHATDTIVITNLRWTPYLGMRTLFIKALAQNQHEGTEYAPMILLKGIEYNTDARDFVEIMANDGRKYQFKKLSLENTDVVLRCSCGDFFYRFNYYNHLDKSLYGRKRRKYESKGIGPPANPLELPGMCKHLLKTAHVLREAGIFQE